MIFDEQQEEIQEMRRKANPKVSAACFLELLTMSIVGSFLPLTGSLPSSPLINTTGSIRDHAANNTLFMQKFQQWYDYVHFRYDITNAALDHANLTADEYPNALSRWTLAWHPLLLTLAYDKTGDAKYLMESKYFVDALYATTSAPYHSLVITPRNGLAGLIDADIPMLWAMQKLNENFGQSYSVTNYITTMKSVARYNNSTDLAWNSPWYGSGDITFDEELGMAAFMGYLTSREVANYASDVQKLAHYVERYRVANFYPYADTIAGARPDLTIIDMVYLLLADYYVPSAMVNSQLQATLNAYGTSNNLLITEDADTGLAAMTELAVWQGYTINERLRTALKQGLAESIVNNTVHALHVPQGERQNIVSMQYLLLALAFSCRTSAPSYAYSGYRNLSSHGMTNVYQLNNTISFNNTDIWGTAYVEYQGFSLMALWAAIDWEWDAFAYNSSLGYYQGYKAGEGSLAGNDVTIRVWENFKKVQMEHSVYNTNPAYLDTLGSESDAVASPCYLMFINGTVYSLAGGSTRTILGSNPLAWYEPQLGLLAFYRIYDNSSTTVKWKITVSGNSRALSATAKRFEAIPFSVPARTPTDVAVTNKAKSLLTEYNNGADMVERDFTFSTASEGSLQWQLKQFSDITVYTDKNMTSASYDGNSLTFTVNADTGETSTTKVYVDAHTNPKSVIGATSWSYDPATKIITVYMLHSSPARIVIFW